VRLNREMKQLAKPCGPSTALSKSRLAPSMTLARVRFQAAPSDSDLARVVSVALSPALVGSSALHAPMPRANAVRLAATVG
jgi:hypothetical protein